MKLIFFFYPYSLFPDIDAVNYMPIFYLALRRGVAEQGNRTCARDRRHHPNGLGRGEQFTLLNSGRFHKNLTQGLPNPGTSAYLV